ncbi:MAG: Inosine-5'-monophosphate dehydrogenase [Candidatus Argoarchaeum ethanivorans]|uniref:Inosine-5'-monophosphate dehydrogenase n=1 Tax=Candidatus Argoarchaeum ethanivorans TaxID=2608793 RepID=A0A811TCV0_9EURY|nr:MAG: Inosine-5'-monophosphate dehydrogenase [Candidatus Argoarchaeum ethanivorans]
MNVNKFMRKHVVSVGEKDHITHARQIMRDHNYQILPVVNADNCLKGIITDKDVMRVTSTRSNVTIDGFVSEVPLITLEDDIRSVLRPMFELRLRYLPVIDKHACPMVIGVIGLTHIFTALNEKIPEKKISDIMKTDVETCERSDALNKVWSNLLDSGISGMPVMDKKEPVGIITIHDIIKSGYTRLDREARHGRAPVKVEKIMNTPLYTISKDETVKACIEQLLRLNVGRLCVIEGGTLVGIVDLYDAAQIMIGT